MDGSWLENTLLCWSVIGWPSIGKRIGGVVAQAVEQAVGVGRDAGRRRVTSELSEEDWLSSGNFWNSSRSTSVWKVGSFSTRSAAASTVTVVVAPPTCKAIAHIDGYNGTHIGVLSRRRRNRWPSPSRW